MTAPMACVRVEEGLHARIVELLGEQQRVHEAEADRAVGADGCGPDGRTQVDGSEAGGGGDGVGALHPGALQGGEGKVSATLAMGEWVPPSEIGELVAFLATGKVRHLTGATIDVNGASYVR
jgi:hypothetical protein